MSMTLFVFDFLRKPSILVRMFLFRMLYLSMTVLVVGFLVCLLSFLANRKKIESRRELTGRIADE